ncbi:MAG: FAD-dependent oxidoreductase [Bdellovibrionales bacterium]|nr:FAD-dependent oxidoreductase [Bdellovibrionales bacterium]
MGTRGADRPRAVVVGAGFTGLATAYALERAGYAVDVYERGDRAGGLIGTTATEFGPAESAANAFLNSARVEALFADLGIPIVPAGRASRARFIFRASRPTRWPLGIGGSLRVALFALRYFFFRRPLEPRAGESLSAWGRRALGEEATEYLLLPAFQGIYAGEGRRLSASLLLAALFTKRPRVLRPKVRGSVSAPGGMGEVVRKLHSTLESRGVRFHFRTDGPLGDPEVLTYFCGSAHQAAESLAGRAPELARALARIEMVPLVSVTAFFAADARVRPGFGVLFPPREGFKSLGVLYNHVIFPDRVNGADLHSETWILGGARRPEIAGMDDAKLLREILDDRKRLHGFEGASESPRYQVLHRWLRATPYYTVELEGILAELSRLGNGSGKLRLMGNYLGGIGLAKILDRIAAEVRAP